MTAPVAALPSTDWFTPERPGATVLASHVERSGHGGWWADDPGAVRTLLVHCGPERLLRGDPARLDPAVLAGFGRGQFHTPDRFLPLLGRTFTHITPWVRVVYVERERPRPVSPHIAGWVRPLGPDDRGRLDRFALRGGGAARSGEPHWTAGTWGGHRGIAASGFSWGAFVGPYLASLACGYLVGRDHLEIAVATDPAFRRLDLALACVRSAVVAAHARGLTPTWCAPESNLASRALAEAAGFRAVGREVVYWVGPARSW
ncbi:GNAT family N-acetyltransferase [Kitasatospora purpeofusca]|uniref:GNAT family N-acetyltransferase n=1 Tax=Kitasatospora purpeofusca TaxID=67352 RepID=UPI002256B916|nr:GNAT family N-acetyltransferase [Kitasatospora purpeofusca]MCX4688573.1 GNAT family N-acetyltransferase [Kitasatospora purpeofusca]